jgi:hypothetical protein
VEEEAAPTNREFEDLNIMRKHIATIWKWIKSYWHWCLLTILLGGLLIIYLKIMAHVASEVQSCLPSQRGVSCEAFRNPGIVNAESL